MSKTTINSLKRQKDYIKVINPSSSPVCLSGRDRSYLVEGNSYEHVKWDDVYWINDHCPVFKLGTLEFEKEHEGFILDHLDESKLKRIRYYFNDNELLQKAIAGLAENKDLQLFINGMIEIKRNIKKHNQQKRIPKKSQNDDRETIVEEII